MKVSSQPQINNNVMKLFVQSLSLSVVYLILMQISQDSCLHMANYALPETSQFSFQETKML